MPDNAPRPIPADMDAEDRPQPFERVLHDELVDIETRRSALFGTRAALPAGTAGIERHAFRRGLLGVGLSGGGIRSATFNLGILQGLAEKGLLPCIDYLSTVSGGGYIGSWLHGVIRRMHDCDPRAAAVRLSPLESPAPGVPENDPVTFLRKYSNYLAPRFSPFSADVWVIGAIWLRNVFLNQCVLVPFLAFLLLVPVVLGLAQQLAKNAREHTLVTTSYWVAAVALMFSVVSMGIRLREIAWRAFNLQRKWVPEAVRRYTLEAGWCAAFVFVAAILMGWTSTNPSKWQPAELAQAGIGLWLLFVLLQGSGGFWSCYARQHDRTWPIALHFLWMPLVCAAVTAALLWGALVVLVGWGAGEGFWRSLTLGPVLVVGCLSTGVALLVGFMGVDYPDAAREWLSRVGAVVLMFAAGWVALFVFGIYAPYLVALLFATYWTAAISVVSGWLATSAAGVLAGYSSRTRTPNDPRSSGPLEWVGKVAPAVFLIGYLTAISFAVHAGLRAVSAARPPQADTSARQTVQVRIESTAGQPSTISVARPETGQPLTVTIPADARGKVELNAAYLASPAWAADVMRYHWLVLDVTGPSGGSSTLFGWPFMPAVVLAGFLLLCISLAFAARVNINEFSIHHFYKNRLVRCYIGASRGTTRDPNPWTGFDPHDDLPLSRLCAANGYKGPYPVLNTTVNLNQGSELAKQHRKAASFTFTPLYCGFAPSVSATNRQAVAQKRKLHADGYRRTKDYATRGGPMIGTAMGISGAAANPNSGYHTSGPLAFLLTVFNVRLGWWLGNPRWDDAARRPGPSFALVPLLSELTAQTNDRSKYLNLSDGGHFDNIGLYELVRRRCRYIIIGDGEQDAGLTFGSLADTIRKCRADFGVDIHIDCEPIREVNRLSRAHAVVATIRYPGEDTTGVLLYIKASLTGDETEDVKEFRSKFPQFPHQSTADQFFNESQFESYRQLGLHIARSVFAPVDRSTDSDCADVGEVFREIGDYWHPQSTASEGTATRHAEAYSALMARLSSDPDLRYLDYQVLKGSRVQPRPTDEQTLRKGHFFCVDCIQLMENVWADLGFRDAAERDNPNNAGWMSVFRHWATQPDLQAAWSAVKETYNPLFRRFVETLRQGKNH